MKRTISVLLVVLLLFACCPSTFAKSITTASSLSSMPDVFRYDIAPKGYLTSGAFAVRKGDSLNLNAAQSTTGISVTADRHNALIAAGWEFKGYEIIDIPSTIEQQLIKTISLNSNSSVVV